MSTVTETIPTFVDIPTTADPTNFDAEADDFLGTQLPAFVASANTWAGQVNVVAGEVNANTVTASTAASDASASEEAAAASAIVAQGAANFVGLYSSLTGAKTAGISAEYQGAIWILNTNSANITADVPGVSSKWTRAYGGGIIYPRTSNIEFVAEDNGKIFEYTSGTFTQTFDEAANLKEGWSVTLKNSGTGVITLDPTSGELINGVATVTLYQGDIAVVICSGTAFSAWVTRATGPVLLSTSTASSSASISFTGLSSIYDYYEVRLINVIPASDGVDLWMRTSTNGGSSYDSGGSDYAYSITTNGGSPAASSGAAQILVSTVSVGSDANETGVSGRVSVFNPSSAKYCDVKMDVCVVDTSSVPNVSSGMGRRLSAADVDAIQFLFASGNIESGIFKLYGWRAN